ncbi:MAG: DUF2147 domain-containing protein [Bacteroidales bacterium]|nr:DUF2147 domain-containing protein [Bacteroidales bacterium]MCF8455892.1 DUF2147 domain-containing protein [Bacteroidales bacterium]
MLKIKLTVSLLLLIVSVSLAQKGDEIIGKYHLPNNLDVEIFELNEKYFGKIIALHNFENGQTVDVNNPDNSRSKDPLIGKVIIKDLEFDSKEKMWVNGNMYSPERGMYFDLKITEINQDEIVAIGSKYFIWKTVKWRKI